MIKTFIKSAPGLYIVNGTTGMLPIILCMILSEFIPDSMAICIGIGAGILLSLFIYLHVGLKVGNSLLLLFLSTFLLVLLGVSIFIPAISIPQGMLPFYAEIGTIILISLLLYEKKKIKKLFLKKNSSHYNEDIMYCIDQGVRYSRLVNFIYIPHFIIACLFLIFASPLGRITDLILLHILPPAILIIAIFINQVELTLFIFLSNTLECIPVLNEKGDVIDKKYGFEMYKYKNQYINPVIRIAIIHKGMLFLSRRAANEHFNTSKIDLPMEYYLRYEESIDEGVSRIMKRAFPNDETELEPRFSIKHRFRNEETDRLIYLHILYVENDSLLSSPMFKDGKLWTFQQIEANLGKNFFGDCFENEYEQLKEAALISEEFRSAE